MRVETKDPGTSRSGFEIPLGWRRRRPEVGPGVEKVNSTETRNRRGFNLRICKDGKNQKE